MRISRLCCFLLILILSSSAFAIKTDNLDVYGDITMSTNTSVIDLHDLGIYFRGAKVFTMDDGSVKLGFGYPATTTTESVLIGSTQTITLDNDLVVIGAGAESYESENVVIGHDAGSSMTAPGTDTWGRHVFVGGDAGIYSRGKGRTLVGYNAGTTTSLPSSSRDYTTYIGYDAGCGSYGGYHTAVGANALEGNTGNISVAVGYDAGRGNTGNYLVALGYYTAKDNEGDDSIFLGYKSGEDNSYDNVFVVGYDTDATASNQIVFGSSAAGDRYYDKMYLGAGAEATSSTIVDFTISATDATTSNRDGANLLLKGGAPGGGTGVAGKVMIRTQPLIGSGSTSYTLPLTSGSEGQVLKLNASNELVFVDEGTTAGATATPTSTNTPVPTNTPLIKYVAGNTSIQPKPTDVAFAARTLGVLDDGGSTGLEYYLQMDASDNLEFVRQIGTPTPVAVMEIKKNDNVHILSNLVVGDTTYAFPSDAATTTGAVLSWPNTGTTLTWSTTAGGGGANTLDDLLDVNVTNTPDDGAQLYVSEGVWVPQTHTPTPTSTETPTPTNTPVNTDTPTPIAFEDLRNVVVTATPADGALVNYDATNDQYEVSEVSIPTQYWTNIGDTMYLFGSYSGDPVDVSSSALSVKQLTVEYGAGENYTFPNVNGGSGQYLRTGGSGTTTWDTITFTDLSETPVPGQLPPLDDLNGSVDDAQVDDDITAGNVDGYDTSILPTPTTIAIRNGDGDINVNTVNVYGPDAALEYSFPGSYGATGYFLEGAGSGGALTFSQVNFTDLAGNITTGQIPNDTVTNDDLANMSQSTIKGRASGAGTGDPQDLSAAQVRTIINVEDGANNYTHPTAVATYFPVTALTGANVISRIQTNTSGHVSSVGTRALSLLDLDDCDPTVTPTPGDFLMWQDDGTWSWAQPTVVSSSYYDDDFLSEVPDPIEPDDGVQNITGGLDVSDSIVSERDSAFDLSSVYSGQDALFLRGDAVASGDDVVGPSIGFSTSGRSSGSNARMAVIASVQTSADYDNAGLAFYTHPSALYDEDLVEAMRIDANGRVGIGEASPDSTLEVNGTIHATGAATFDGGLINDDTNNSFRVLFPDGGSGYFGPNVVTGAIEITLPVTVPEQCFCKMRVEVFDYSSNESFTVLISGYIYDDGNAWVNETVTILGNDVSRDFDVRFGRDGTTPKIWIGELTDSWSHCGVAVTEFVGFYGGVAEDYADGWSIEIEGTSFDTVEVVKDANFLWGDLTDGSGSGLDADTVDTWHASVAPNPTTIAVRDSSGDLKARTFITNTYSLPTDDGDADQYLKTDGNNVDWATINFDDISGEVTDGQLSEDYLLLSGGTLVGDLIMNGADIQLGNNYISNDGDAEGISIDTDGDVTMSNDLTVDTNTFHIDTTDNRVAIGTTSPDEELHIEGSSDVAMKMLASNGGYPKAYLYAFSNIATDAPVVVGYRGRGSEGSKVAAANNDRLLRILGGGYDSNTSLRSAADILFNQDGSDAVGYVNGEIVFRTANGSDTLNDRLTIRSDGTIGVGKDPTNGLLDVNGSIYTAADGNSTQWDAAYDDRFKWDGGDSGLVASTGRASLDVPQRDGTDATGTWGIDISKNAATASKWATARTISLTSDVTGSTSIDGSGDVSITTTVGNDSHTHDTRYYTETESDDRYLQLSGGTLTGNLTMGTSTHITIGTGGYLQMTAGSGPAAYNNIRLANNYISNDASTAAEGISIDTAGNVTMTDDLTVTGALSADSAVFDTPLADASVSDTLTIGSGGSVDKGALENTGTLGFDWSDGEVANDITADNYLPLSGGTMTGAITMSGGTSNIRLGGNYINGDSTDNEGLTVSNSGSVTMTEDLYVNDGVVISGSARDGRLSLNTTTDQGHVIVARESNTGDVGLYGYSTGVGTDLGGLIILGRANQSIADGAPTAYTVDGQQLGAIYFKGVANDDVSGKEFQEGASIAVTQNDSYSDTDVPAKMNFTASDFEFSRSVGGEDAYVVEVRNQAGSDISGGIKIYGGGSEPSATPVAGYEYTPLTFADGDGTVIGGIYAGIDSTTYNVGFYDLSDASMKKDIRDTTTTALSIVNRVPVRDYKWVGSNTDVTGWVADDVEVVYPSAVRDMTHKETVTRDDGTTATEPVTRKYILQGKLLPMMWKAIQEQQVIIDAQQQEIDALKKDVQEVQAWIAKQRGVVR